MPKLLFAKTDGYFTQCLPGNAYFPNDFSQCEAIKRNNTDGFKFSKGPDFHRLIAYRILIIRIFKNKLLKMLELQKPVHF